MLTSVGRAAARRVVASANVSRSSLNSNAVLVNRPAFILRPVSVRSFSVSRWNALATKDSTESPAKKKTTTTKKATKTAKGTKATKAPKKKKAAPKKKVVKAKKPKKEKTPEEKKAAEVKVLKKQALLKEEPATLPTNGWALFVQQRFSDHHKQSDGLVETIKHLKVDYENVPSMEKERLESQGAANRQTNANKRQAWIQSLPVEDVYLANAARRRLRTLQAVKQRANNKLEDERLPKRPLNPYSRFVKARFAAVGPGQTSGQDAFKSSQEIFKQSSQEWRNLREAEKQQYEREFEQEMEAYREQMDKVKAKAKAKAEQTKKETAEALVAKQRELQAAYRARKAGKEAN